MTAGSHARVLEIITLCSQHRIALVPFGGGSSVGETLDLVPVGRGNDFARQLGIPGDVGPGAHNVIAPDRSKPGQT